MRNVRKYVQLGLLTLNIPVSSYIFMGEEKDHRKSKCLNHTANSGRVTISA